MTCTGCGRSVLNKILRAHKLWPICTVLLIIQTPTCLEETSTDIVGWVLHLSMVTTVSSIGEVRALITINDSTGYTVFFIPHRLWFQFQTKEGCHGHPGFCSLDLTFRAGARDFYFHEVIKRSAPSWPYAVWGAYEVPLEVPRLQIKKSAWKNRCRETLKRRSSTTLPLHR